MNWWYLLACGAYTVAIIAWAYLLNRKHSAAAYMKYPGGLDAFTFALTTFATGWGPFNMIVGFAIAYICGFWYLLLLVGFGMSHIALYFIYKYKFQQLQEGRLLLSLGDTFIAERFKSTGYLINVVQCALLVVMITIQISTNTTLLTRLTNAPAWIILLVTVVTMSFYIYYGGFKAVVDTDIPQGFLTFFVLVVVFFASPIEGNIASSQAVYVNQFWFGMGLAIMQFLTYTPNPANIERVLDTMNERELKWGLIGSYAMSCVLASIILYTGLIMRSNATSEALDVFITMVEAFPTLYVGMLLIGMCAAFMSTVDSLAHVFGSTIANVTAQTLEGKRCVTRWCSMSVIIVATILALRVPDLMRSLLSVYPVAALIGVVFVIDLIGKPKAWQMNTLLVLGISVHLANLKFAPFGGTPMAALTCVWVAIALYALMRACAHLRFKR